VGYKKLLQNIQNESLKSYDFFRQSPMCTRNLKGFFGKEECDWLTLCLCVFSIFFPFPLHIIFITGRILPDFHGFFLRFAMGYCSHMDITCLPQEDFTYNCGFWRACAKFIHL
jgi:hypothetical protein